MLIRRKYWVIGGRNYIRKVLHTCRQKYCRPVKNYAVKMGRIPVERTDSPCAFTNVMLDYLGPFNITHKCPHESYPHQTGVKSYVILLTCFHSRALHLELTRDLSTEQFHMAYRRFVARREYGCEWTFSTVKSPWENGMAERLVGSVKRALRKVLGSCAMSYDELTTALCEVEQQINNRPLCAVNDDNSMLPITPAEIIAGRPLTALADPPTSKEVNDKLDYPVMWRRRRTLLNAFWKRWREDYMIMLSPTKKWRQSDENMLNVGDVVLIREHDAKRNTWKMARVLEIYKNARGDVTSAKLKVPNGRPIHRSVRNLCLLEADMTVKGPPSGEERHHEVLSELDNKIQDTVVTPTNNADEVKTPSGVRRSRKIREREAT